MIPVAIVHGEVVLQQHPVPVVHCDQRCTVPVAAVHGCDGPAMASVAVVHSGVVL